MKFILGDAVMKRSLCKFVNCRRERQYRKKGGTIARDAAANYKARRITGHYLGCDCCWCRCAKL